MTTKVKIPIGVEKVLCRAAADPTFKEVLLQDRRRALGGLALKESEALVLESVSDTALAAMIDQIDLPSRSRRSFLGRVAACALGTAAAGMVMQSCLFSATGSAPDIPPPRPDGGTLPVDAPQPAPMGIAPNRPPLEPRREDGRDPDARVMDDPTLLLAGISPVPRRRLDGGAGVERK